MTTTTRWRAPEPRRQARRRAPGGFTLVEVMIASVLGSFVLVAVLTAFLFLGRSGANIQNYNDMEAQARRALELFAQDTRQASAVTWNSADSVTLVVDTTAITYAFAGTALTRTVAGGTATPIVTGITSFSFLAYTITGVQITDFSTAAARLTAAKDTKQIQISLAASRTTQTVATATNTVLSARFILRNKRVTT